MIASSWHGVVLSPILTLVTLSGLTLIMDQFCCIVFAAVDAKIDIKRVTLLKKSAACLFFLDVSVKELQGRGRSGSAESVQGAERSLLCCCHRH